MLSQLEQHDPISKLVLNNLLSHLQIRLYTFPEGNHVEKLQCYLTLIFVKTHLIQHLAQAAEHFRNCLDYARRGHIKEYEDWAEGYHFPDLFGHMLSMKTVSHFGMSVRLRFYIYLASHYRLIAELTDSTSKKARLNEQAETFIRRGFEIHRLLMDLALTSEYLIGRAFPANIDSAAQYFKDVAVIAHDPALTPMERDSIKVHCKELLRAAPQLGIEEHSLLDQVKIVAQRIDG